MVECKPPPSGALAPEEQHCSAQRQQRHGRGLGDRGKDERMNYAVRRLAVTYDVAFVIDGPRLAVSSQADAGEAGGKVGHLAATVTEGVIRGGADGVTLADDGAGTIDTVGDAAIAAESAQVVHVAAAITERMPTVVAGVAFADDSAGIVNAVGGAEHAAKGAQVVHVADRQSTRLNS